MRPGAHATAGTSTSRLGRSRTPDLPRARVRGYHLPVTDFSYEGNRYRAEVVRWVDGDTVILRVDLGQGVLVQPKKGYRIARIDAPETALRKGVTRAEKTAGLALKETLTALYPTGTTVWIATSKGGRYDRYVAEVWMRDLDGGWRNLSDWLLGEGLAEPYEERS